MHSASVAAIRAGKFT